MNSAQWLTIHRIIECPELEGAHKGHQVQLLAPHGSTQKSHQMFESIVRTLPELQQTLP